MNIVTQGEKRFHIHQTYDDKSYLTADVAFFNDVREEPLSARLVDEVIQAFRAGGGTPDILSEEMIDDSARLSFKIGAALKLPLPDKQALLESDSRGDRLRSLVRWIGEKKHRLERVSHKHENASQNGHPKKPDS